MAIGRFSEDDSTRIWDHLNRLATEAEQEIATLTPAWKAFTPVWSNAGGPLTLGGASLEGRWTQVGKLVHAMIRFQRGPTSGQGGTAWWFTLPVRARAFEWITGSGMVIGTAFRFPVTVYGVDVGQVGLLAPSGTVNWGSGSWQDGDRVIFGMTYEAV